MQNLNDSINDYIKQCRHICFGDKDTAFETWSESLTASMKIISAPLVFAVTAGLYIVGGALSFLANLIPFLLKGGKDHLTPGLTLMCIGVVSAIAAIISPFGQTYNIAQRAVCPTN